MESPPGAPPWLEVVTAEERPEQWSEVADDGRFARLWPEYNLHGNNTPAYFGALVPRFASHQALLVDTRSSEVVARGRTIPWRWDGTAEDLPEGIDALGLRAVDERRAPNALCALAAEVASDRQGEGLSRLVVATMARLAARDGLEALVAPVRPSRKDRYPLIQIDRYRQWRRPDGQLFDPWLRVHERLGGRQLRAAPRSLEITAPAADWEQWTSLVLPEDGSYVFPGGLAPLEVRAGTGAYFEPNVWVRHEPA